MIASTILVIEENETILVELRRLRFLKPAEDHQKEQCKANAFQLNIQSTTSIQVKTIAHSSLTSSKKNKRQIGDVRLIRGNKSIKFLAFSLTSSKKNREQIGDVRVIRGNKIYLMII